MTRRFLAALFLLAAIASLATAATRKPLMEEFTNVRCGPCADHDGWLTQFIANHPDDLSVVYYHMYWPGNDPWWNDNPEHNGPRRTYYAVNAVPSNRIDGTEPASYPYTLGVLESRYNAAMTVPTRVDIAMTGSLGQGAGVGWVDVSVTAEAPLPPNTYIHVALVENDLYWVQGIGNYDWHHYVMHTLLTGPSGELVEPFDGPYPQTRDYQFGYAVDAGWTGPPDENNCRMVVWLQDNSTKQILNSEMVSFTDFALVAAPDVPADIVLSEIGAIHPNPFNPTTSIPIVMSETGKIDLRIYAADGSVVRTLAQTTLPAGTTHYAWDGLNDGGATVASGTYFVHLVTEEKVSSRAITLMK